MLLLWLLSAVSPSPEGVQSNWQRIGQGKDGAVFFIDYSTVQSQSDGSVKAWTRRDKMPDSRYSHENVLMSFKCYEHTSKYEAAVSYLHDGTVGNDQYKPEKRFLPISPNSMDWKTMEQVCKLAEPASSR